MRNDESDQNGDDYKTIKMIVKIEDDKELKNEDNEEDNKRN